MKANTPEIIWIDPINDLPKLSGHIDNDSVEYTRIDAFINKACAWLINNTDITHTGIKNFCKAMKGEKV